MVFFFKFKDFHYSRGRLKIVPAQTKAFVPQPREFHLLGDQIEKHPTWQSDFNFRDQRVDLRPPDLSQCSNTFLQLHWGTVGWKESGQVPI